MLKLITVVCVVAAVYGQHHGDFNLNEFLAANRVDDIHGYAVEYDDQHDLILLLGSANCYLISAPDKTWDTIITHPDHITPVTEELYHQVAGNHGVTLISHQAAEDKYHSRLEEWSCRNKDVYEVVYKPLSANSTIAPVSPH